MNKTDLIISLIRIRLTRAAKAEGLSKEEAEAKADAFLRQQQIGGSTALSTPEGSIATIVETYMNSIGKAMVDSGLTEDSPNFDSEFRRANDYIIGAIEGHRSKMHPGASNYPKDIDGYVFYRLKIEMAAVQGIKPEDIGLNPETVKVLTHTAKAHFMQRTVNGSGGGGTKSCFVATMCYGDADAPNVMTLRRFRDRVLKRSELGRAFVFWYYRVGPHLANALASHPTLRAVIRNLLGKVAKRISRRYQV